MRKREKTKKEKTRRTKAFVWCFAFLFGQHRSQAGKKMWNNKEKKRLSNGSSNSLICSSKRTEKMSKQRGKNTPDEITKPDSWPGQKAPPAIHFNFHKHFINSLTRDTTRNDLCRCSISRARPESKTRRLPRRSSEQSSFQACGRVWQCPRSLCF